jgi:diacylglycerol kinase
MFQRYHQFVMGDWLWLPQRTALREEMIALPAGLVAAYLIAPTIAWLVAMIGSLLGLLAVEFLNTAIEKLSDHVSPEHHKGIGRIKGLWLRGRVQRHVPSTRNQS